MIKYAFDLDGTVTKVETLPLLAAELDLSEEMKLLTDLTLSGDIPFDKSFKLRYLVLRNIPPKRIADIMSKVELDEDIAAFIKSHKAPIVEKLGCESYSSTSELDANGLPVLKNILSKAEAIRDLRKTADKVVAVGESFNDVPMFEEADVAVSYGGVHKPVDTAISVSDYVVFEGGALCRLLKML